MVAEMSASSSEGAREELLSIMCNAVVHLDESLMRTASSPTLDGLLLRLPKVDPELVTSLLDVTDQVRFVEFAGRSDGTAQSLHVTFCGGSGTRLRAQLYHKRFEDVAGRTRHLIGIVELRGGSQLMMSPWSVSRELEPWQVGRRRGVSCASSDSDSEESGIVSDHHSTASSTSSDSPFVPILPVDQEK